MAEEKKEPWLNYVALTTVIFAVCATLSTFKGGQFSTRAVMSQSQASDQWAYYQAKSIKAYLYEGRQEALALQLQTEHPGPEQKAELEKRIGHYAGQIKRYEQEKADISAKAKALEEIREEAQRNSSVFGLAIIFLQIAILLSSIAAFMKKKPVWLLGMAVGVVGMLYFVNGFAMFF